jgi:hypothetical protein
MLRRCLIWDLRLSPDPQATALSTDCVSSVGLGPEKYPPACQGHHLNPALFGPGKENRKLLIPAIGYLLNHPLL